MESSSIVASQPVGMLRAELVLPGIMGRDTTLTTVTARQDLALSPALHLPHLSYVEEQCDGVVEV